MCVMCAAGVPPTNGDAEGEELVWTIPERMGRDSERSWQRGTCKLCLVVELPVNFSCQHTGRAVEVSGQNSTLFRNWEVL